MADHVNLIKKIKSFSLPYEHLKTCLFYVQVMSERLLVY